MLSVRRSEVFQYLHCSEFFKSLSNEDESCITIPEQCYWPDSKVQTVTDCVRLLHTIRFWGLHSVPNSLIEFLMNCDVDKYAILVQPFTTELRFLNYIKEMKEKDVEVKRAAAAQSGRAELVEYLIEHNMLQPSAVCEIVAIHPSSDLLRHFHEKGFNLSSPSCLRTAATYGSLECIKYLFMHSCPWDDFTCVYAAEGGHLDCLRYLHEQGCPWDSNTCTYAALNGHMHCLVYAHEQGCPWDSETSGYTASAGHLNCLQYLHEHGCPCDETVTEAAVFGGQLGCLQYLHSQGCAWDAGACRMAAWKGHLECLQYLHEHGCPWNADTCTAAATGHLPCLAYAHEHGCEWNELTFERATSVECIEYLVANNCPRNDSASQPFKTHSCMYTCM